MAVRGCTLSVKVGEVFVVGADALFLYSAPMQVKYQELGLVQGLYSLFSYNCVCYNIYCDIYM